MWVMKEVLPLMRQIEAVAPFAGAHIGLTGGLLYKDGVRKDLDVVVYRIRQRELDRARFFEYLRAIDINVRHDYGFVVKAELNGRSIDFLFPESETGTYVQGDNA